MLVQRTLPRRFLPAQEKKPAYFIQKTIIISMSHFPNCGDVWTPWNWTWATPPKHVIPLQSAKISRTHHMCLVCSSRVICSLITVTRQGRHKIQQSVCCHQDAIRLPVTQLKAPWLSSIVWIYKRKRNVTRQFYICQAQQWTEDPWNRSKLCLWDLFWLCSRNYQVLNPILDRWRFHDILYCIPTSTMFQPEPGS